MAGSQFNIRKLAGLSAPRDTMPNPNVISDHFTKPVYDGTTQYKVKAPANIYCK